MYVDSVAVELDGGQDVVEHLDGDEVDAELGIPLPCRVETFDDRMHDADRAADRSGVTAALPGGDSYGASFAAFRLDRILSAVRHLGEPAGCGPASAELAGSIAAECGTEIGRRDLRPVPKRSLGAASLRGHAASLGERAAAMNASTSVRSKRRRRPTLKDRKPFSPLQTHQRTVSGL